MFANYTTTIYRNAANTAIATPLSKGKWDGEDGLPRVLPRAGRSTYIPAHGSVERLITHRPSIYWGTGLPSANMRSVTLEEKM